MKRKLRARSSSTVSTESQGRSTRIVCFVEHAHQGHQMEAGSGAGAVGQRGGEHFDLVGASRARSLIDACLLVR